MTLLALNVCVPKHLQIMFMFLIYSSSFWCFYFPGSWSFKTFLMSSESRQELSRETFFFSHLSLVAKVDGFSLAKLPRCGKGYVGHFE